MDAYIDAGLDWLTAHLAWRVAGRKVALFSALGLALPWNLRLWEATLETLVMVFFATLIAVGFGLPLGIWAALWAEKSGKPSNAWSRGPASRPESGW